MAFTLAVERSTAPGSWAVYRDGDLLAARTFDATPPRAPAWVAEFKAALDELGIAPAALAQLVVGTGPGSFSGIRGAIAALQGMALPRGLPLYGLSSAAVLADACLRRTVQERVAVVGDARRNQLWCAVYQRLPGGTLVLSATGKPPRHASQDFTLPTRETLGAAMPPDARIVTPDGARLASCLEQPGIGCGLPAEQRMPTALALGALFWSDRAAARLDPVPVYLHPAVG
jgi:tRNA threonylcarbamoyladenosine biosynthesis protein TsaB